MYAYEMPVFASSLIELPMVLDYLDDRYGLPDISVPKKKNGEYALRLVLKYLSLHKRSTCEEIAQYEFDRNISSKRKLKSITDDIRKFVKHNLIHSQLVLHDEPKRKYNKQVKTYSLSPIGILYSMYLFANFRPDDSGLVYELSSIDRNFIKNLAIEYSDTLPKVFGRFKLFKKIFGKEFESIIINPFITIYETEIEGIPSEEFLLTNYVLTTYEVMHGGKMETQELIAEQISLIFYAHLEESIENELHFKDNDFEKISKMNPDELAEYNNERNKNATNRHREILAKAREMWIQIMNEDKELKKWYTDFLKEVKYEKRREQYIVAQYLKDGFHQWNFPKS